MNAHAAITPAPCRTEESGSAVAALVRSSLPLDIGWLDTRRSALPAPRHQPLAFRFCFDEVPFDARVSWQGDRAVLALVGALGTLPFTVEDGRRRQQLESLLAAARRGSGLDWRVDNRQEMAVLGSVEIAAPVTPTALFSSLVALLLRCRPYLAVLADDAAEACGSCGIVSTSPG